jgi:hypothetical protein
LAHVWRHTIRNRRRHARLEFGVAFDAARESLLELEAQFFEDLPQLRRDLIVADQDGADDARLDHAPFGQVSIAGQEHPALGRCLADQLGIVDPRVVRGVVSQRPQPACEAPDVAVGEEPRLHLVHLRIRPWRGWTT